MQLAQLSNAKRLRPTHLAYTHLSHPLSQQHLHLVDIYSPYRPFASFDRLLVANSNSPL